MEELSFSEKKIAFLFVLVIVYIDPCKGAQWLSGRVLDSRPKGCWFEPSPASLRCGP